MAFLYSLGIFLRGCKKIHRKQLEIGNLRKKEIQVLTL